MSDNDTGLTPREGDFGELDQLRTSMQALVLFADFEMALERQLELHTEDQAVTTAIGAVRSALHDILDQPSRS